jgi:hypothetical protein
LDKFNASYLADAKLIDFSQLARRLEQQQIGAVVLSEPLFSGIHGQPWWPRDLSTAINANYSYACTVGKNFYKYRVLLPNEKRK